MGESLPAYLSLRSTEPLHDLSIHVSGDGGGANLGTAHVPQTVGSSPSWATLDLDVNNPGTGTFDARITAHDAANRSVTASESFSYATAARTVTLSTSGLADAELQALSLRRESMSTSAYARAASVLTTGKAQQAAAVEHAITDASPVDMTTVTGQIRYTDVNGQTHPAREIDVDILDDTGVAGGARAGCATTDANGDFSATVATARTDGTPRKLYLRAWAQSVLPAVVPNNPCAWRTQNGGTGTGFVVVDPATNQNQSVTSSTVVNATTGSVTMPTLVIGASNAASTSFDVADAMVTGDDYLNKYRGNPYGFLAVDYPWTKLDSDGDPQMYFNAPTTIVVPAGEQFNWDSMLHEFGHYVGYNLNIDTSGGGAHGFSQNDASVCQQSKGPCNPLGKKAGLAQAWSEGFATFFSLMAQNVMNVAALNIPDPGDASYDDHQVHLDDIQMGVDNASLDGQLPAKGEDDELSVVRALWHIYTDSSLGLSDAGILNGLQTAGASTLSAAVPALLDAAGATPFDASKPLDSQAEKKTDTVACVLTGQAVSPEITDPPSVSTAGSAYPPTISWNPNGAGPLNPLEQFQVQFWSADWTQLLFTSPPTTDNFYAPAPAQWHALLSITENGNPISAYHVAVVGTSTDPPSTGPYRSCAITLNAPETPAELKGPGPSGGDLTGQSVGISRDGSDAIVGSPGTCDGYGATDACDLSSIGFWSYDATTAAWKQLASFDQEQLGITGCGPGDCSEAVSVGTSVAMSGDGLTAAATVAIDPTYTPGDSDGPWSIAVVTFAKENGTWVLTGEPGPNGEDGVIDNGIDQSTLSLVYHVPLESVALDNTGDELLVGDPYHTNDLNLLSTAENPKNSQGIVDVFSSAGHGDPSGFRSTSTIADPTVDPFLSDEASCTNPDADCTNWDEHFALPIAVSGDGKTVAISDTAEYYTRAASYNIFETVDVFHGTGTGAARSWGMPTALNGSDVNTVYSVPLGGGFECNGVPCTGPDDFGAALTNSDTPPGSGIAISDDGSTVVVGNPGHNNDAGSAYVFTANPAGAGYTQAGELTSDSANTASLGYSVAVSPDGATVLAGAPDSTVGANSEAGEVDVFTAGSDGWADANQSDVVVAPDADAYNVFGTSVALSGTGSVTLIGSPGTAFTSGPGGYSGQAYFSEPETPTTTVVSAPDLTTTPSGGAQGSTGQPITLTTTVNPPPPQGAVSFSDANGVVAGCASVPVDAASGTATCSVILPPKPTVDETLADSPIGYTATFGGGGAFLGSTSAEFDITVVSPLAITTTALGSVPAGVQLSGMTLQASGGTGALTWLVAPNTPDNLPSTVQLDADGTLTGQAPVAGQYTFTAEVMDSSPAVQTDTRTLTLTATANSFGALTVALEPIAPAVYGVGASITAVVSFSGAAPPPAGDKVSIAAAIDTTPSGACTARLNGGATDAAQCVLPPSLGIGTYTVTATFEGSTTTGGDPNYPTTISAPGTLNVQPVPTVTTLTQPSPADAGQATNITVTVAPSAGFTAVPAGDTVAIDAVLQGTGSDEASCTATLIGTVQPSGTCNLGTGLIVGTYVVAASFTGDPQFLPSTATATLTVVDGTTTKIAVSSPSVAFGTTVTYTATVTAADAAAPAGTVSITSGATAICSTSTFTGDVASCPSGAAPVGNDTITATFTSESGFATSAGTTALTVTVTPPPAPPGSTNSQTASSATFTTVTASVPGVSSSGTGVGAITVATYGGTNPTGSAVTAGTGVFYDVAVGTGSTFSVLTITACSLGAGNALQWWNGSVWQPFSNQVVDTTPPNTGCVTATVEPAGSSLGTSPTIEELTGTPIAALDLATGDFSVHVSPSTQSLGELGSVGYTVSVDGTGGFGEPVNLSVSNLPSGVTGRFFPATVVPNGTSILTLTSGATLTSSGGSFTVTGTSGAIAHSDTSASVALNFELQPTCFASITGTVTDAQTDQPVKGAVVLLNGSDVATSASNGTYIVSQVPLGPNNGTTNVYLQFVASGYYNLLSPLILVSCGPVSSYSPVLTEEEFGMLTGHVYVGIANPANPGFLPPIPTSTVIPGAQVVLIETNANGSGTQVGTTTAADGSYSFSQVPLGLNNASVTDGETVNGPATPLSQYPLGFWPAQPLPKISGGSVTTADVALVPICTGSLSAVVYSEDTGQLLAGATVSDGISSAVTDSTGTAQFPSVALSTNNSPRTYSFSAANAAGTGRSVGLVQTSLAGCGDSASVALYVHVPVSNYGNAVINVVDATTNQPITNASVQACSLAPNGSTQGPAGTFTYSGVLVGQDAVTSGTCQFLAGAAGYYPNTANVTINSGLTTTATIALIPEEPSTITGSVTNATTGAPVAGIQVSDGFEGVTTDASGHYTFTSNDLLGTNNASQLDTLTFFSPNSQYLSGYGSVTAVAGQTETLNIALVPQCGPATVTGIVYNAANQQPIPGANIGETSSDTNVTTNANGQFVTQVKVFDNQAFTDFFTASAIGFNSKTEGIQLFCGAHIDLNFGQNSNEFGTLTGTVTAAATGIPVSGAFVGAGFGATTTTDAQGVYTFTNVPLGNNNAAETWDVTVDPPNGSPLQPQVKSVPVPGNATTTLNFTLTTTPPPLPVAADYQQTTPEGVTLAVPAASGLLSKSTGTGDLATVVSITGPHAFVNIAVDGTYTYTPDPTFVGSDSFTYTLTDEYGRTASGTVSVDVTGSGPTTTTTSSTTSTTVAPTTTTTASTSTTTTTVPRTTTTTSSTTSTTVAPTTTTTASTSTTTTTGPSTTTSTTTAGPTTSTSTTIGVQGGTTTTAAPTTSTSTSGAVPVTTGGQAAAQSAGETQQPTGSLPFTGSATTLLLLCGVALVGTGRLMVARRRARR